MKKKRPSRKSIISFWNKVSSDRTTVGIVIACICLIFACIILCGIHVSRIIDLFSNTYYEKIDDSIETADMEIVRSISRKADFLNASAATLATMSKDSTDSVTEMLAALATTSQLDGISYVRKYNSIEYTSDGTLRKVKYDDIEEAIENTNGNVAVFITDEDRDKGMFTVACPVVRGNIKDGYLLGKVKAQEQLQTYFEVDSSVSIDGFLIDGDGTIICADKGGTEIQYNSGDNFYEDVLPLITNDYYDAVAKSEEIRMNVFSGMRGDLICNSKKYKNVYVAYAPVPVTRSWTIVYCMSGYSMRSMLRPIVTEAVLTVIALIFLVIIMAGMGFHYAARDNKKIHSLAYTDELTEAPNENAFKETVKELLEDNPDIPYVIACFDILNFRYINEGYGHEKADILLKALSQALKESLSYNEMYARIGADRFVSLTVDDGREGERKNFIDDYIAKISSNIMMNYPVRIKTGIYYISNREEQISSMIDKANLARKAVDNNTPGLVMEYVDKLMEATRRQENIESRMEMALANHEFVPFLQPKWNMQKDCICGAEALVRWRRPDGSIVPPGEFIPLFEKNGFIEKLDFYMLDSICAYIRRMLDEGRDVYPVSINQSRFLMHNPEYISKIQQILLKYKIPSRLVELEITETVFTHDKDHMLKIMNELKAFNMELSMDDFGSGYSSLNLLRDIPFDVLKIDRGFLDESTQSESGKWILRKIVEMAEGLDLRVICEGVETHEQVEMLLDIGCIYAQGFLYSRPIPLEEFEEKYNTPKQ